jgi:hypothetical protein
VAQYPITSSSSNFRGNFLLCVCAVLFVDQVNRQPLGYFLQKYFFSYLAHTERSKKEEKNNNKNREGKSSFSPCLHQLSKIFILLRK